MPCSSPARLARGRRRQADSGPRDDFRRDLSASIAASVRAHGIDYIPGAADLGDFDPTSTTIVAQTRRRRRETAEGPLLEATFDRYWREFVRRRDGETAWDAYTPYELRNIGAFTRLGRRDRAGALLDFFLKDRRPLPGTAGPRSWGARRASRASSATCPTPGWRPTMCARCSTCSPSSERATTPWCWAPAYRPAGSRRRRRRGRPRHALWPAYLVGQGARRQTHVSRGSGRPAAGRLSCSPGRSRAGRARRL